MKKFIYTDDDLLKFFCRQIKAIDVDAKESDKDKIVSATIIYKNGSETDCKLPRKLIDYLIDRVNGLFKTEEVNYSMKKYTDTELLEKVLPMLRYSIDNYGDKDNDIVGIKILESNYSYAVNKSFVVALQNRVNELAKKTRVEATNTIVGETIVGEDKYMCEDAVCEDTERIEKCNDEDKDIGCCPSEDIEHTNRRWGDCEERTYSSKEYYELRGELSEKDHEIWKLKRTIEALEYLIYNCIPKDDRRKD